MWARASAPYDAARVRRPPRQGARLGSATTPPRAASSRRRATASAAWVPVLRWTGSRAPANRRGGGAVRERLTIVGIPGAVRRPRPRAHHAGLPARPRPLPLRPLLPAASVGRSYGIRCCVGPKITASASVWGIPPAVDDSTAGRPRSSPSVTTARLLRGSGGLLGPKEAATCPSRWTRERVDPRPSRGSREVLGLRAAPEKDLSVIGLGSGCKVARFSSQDGGGSWTRAGGGGPTWHLSPASSPDTVASPAGPRTPPCTPAAVWTLKETSSGSSARRQGAGHRRHRSQLGHAGQPPRRRRHPLHQRRLRCRPGQAAGLRGGGHAERRRGEPAGTAWAACRAPSHEPSARRAAPSPPRSADNLYVSTDGGKSWPGPVRRLSRGYARPMKVLVTGGAGYIGSTTAKALEEAGHTPVIFDSLLTGPRAFVGDRAFYEGDVADRSCCRGGRGPSRHRLHDPHGRPDRGAGVRRPPYTTTATTSPSPWRCSTSWSGSTSHGWCSPPRPPSMPGRGVRGRRRVAARARPRRTPGPST